jgi:flagellar hook-associated protein 1 FlgK
MFVWALEVAKSALFSQQTAIYVTSHNIANVNTPDYSRQQVVLSTLGPVNLPVGYLGRGVWVEEVRRIYDRFLMLQVNSQQSEKSFWETHSKVLSQMETLLGDSEEGGFGTLMDEFFNAWHQLSLNPQGYGERVALLRIAENLSELISYKAKSLSQTRQDLVKEIESALRDINRLLSEIAQINGKIRLGRNDLFDERDRLLKELSAYLNFTVLEDGQGRVTLLIGGVSLVEGLEVHSLTLESDPSGKVKIKLKGPGTFDVTSFVSLGKLGALIKAENEILPSFSEKLDEFVKMIISEVNKLHSEGEGQKTYTQIESLYDLNDPPFQIPKGSFQIRLYNQNGDLVTYSVNFDGDLQDLIDQLNQITGLHAEIENGRLRIYADPGYSFSFARADKESSGIVSALGLNLFFTGWDASTIGLNPLLEDDPAYISAASNPKSPDDNSNALLIGELGGGPFKEFYNSIMGEIGLMVKDAQKRFEVSEGLLQSLQARREEISGVSLDEEMLNLIKFQRSYEAAAKLVRIIDELLETLISLR